jgi:hypothetical protein
VLELLLLLLMGCSLRRRSRREEAAEHDFAELSTLSFCVGFRASVSFVRPQFKRR